MSVLIPYEPEKPFRQVLEYSTSVAKSISGLEFREAHNQHARERYEMDMLLEDDESRYLARYLSQDPGQDFEMPLWHESAIALTDVTDSNSVTVDDTILDWATVGQRVIVVGPGGNTNYFASDIASNSGGVLTLNDTAPSGQIFPAGVTRVMPLVTGKIFDSVPRGAWPVNLTRWSLSFIRSDFSSTWGTGADLTGHDLLPVLDRRQKNDDLVQSSIIGDLEVIDFGKKFEFFSLKSFADIHRAYSWSLRTAADRQWWKLFLDTCVGRQKPFLCPTWREDLLVHTQPTPATNTLKVKNSESYRTLWFTSAAHKRLQLELNDGSVLYVSVYSAADGGDGSDVLTLQDDLPAGSYTVTKISFLELCRLDSDQITVEWLQ